MALLQISEPGQSTTPHQHRLAVGIDLGTTNSLVASVRSGEVQTLPDEDGSHLLPSVVRYLADGVEVGTAAAVSAAMVTSSRSREGPLGRQATAKNRVTNRDGTILCIFGFNIFVSTSVNFPKQM